MERSGALELLAHARARVGECRLPRPGQTKITDPTPRCPCYGGSSRARRRRTVDLDEMTTRLATLATQLAETALPTFCDELLAGGPSDIRDDIALLGVRLHTRPDTRRPTTGVTGWACKPARQPDCPRFRPGPLGRRSAA
jgi:hypothetical protein